MIKYIVIVFAGIGIGYTYGYMHGAAGERDLVATGLHTVGIGHASRDDDESRAAADSVRNARATRAPR
jgi:hypothetical protein